MHDRNLPCRFLYIISHFRSRLNIHKLASSLSAVQQCHCIEQDRDALDGEVPIVNVIERSAKALVEYIRAAEG